MQTSPTTDVSNREEVLGIRFNNVAVVADCNERKRSSGPLLSLVLGCEAQDALEPLLAVTHEHMLDFRVRRRGGHCSGYEQRVELEVRVDAAHAVAH